MPHEVSDDLLSRIGDYRNVDIFTIVSRDRYMRLLTILVGESLNEAFHVEKHKVFCLNDYVQGVLVRMLE